MIGFFSACDEGTNVNNMNLSFIHISSDDDNEDIVRSEMAPFALTFARHFNLEKVYLFYGKDKKITYDYTL